MVFFCYLINGTNKPYEEAEDKKFFSLFHGRY
jgi:hypothetical protein